VLLCNSWCLPAFEQAREKRLKELTELDECRVANWPQGSDLARKRRSLNGWRASLCAESLLERTCFVCGEEHVATKTRLHEKDNPETQEHLLRFRMAVFPTAASTPPDLLEGIPVERAGFVSTRAGKEAFVICHYCDARIAKCILPPRALANSLDLGGPVPAELLGLTIPEQMLISKLRVKSCIMKLKRGIPGAFQHGTKGHCIAFPEVQLLIFRVFTHPSGRGRGGFHASNGATRPS